MAQTPDIQTQGVKTAPPDQYTPDRKVEAAVKQTAAAAPSTVDGMQSATRHDVEAMHDAGRDLGESLRHTGHAGTEAVQKATQIGAETAGHAAEELEDGQRTQIEDMAERFESIGRHMAIAAQENASDLRSFLVPPGGSGDTLRDLQQGISGLVSGVVQTNVRMTQHLLRMTDPSAVIDLQRRFMRDYMDALLEGTGAIVRATRQSADQTLRPIETRIEQRQQALNGRNGHAAAE